jgi:mono/diheme cytochrome c family protein
MRGVIEAYDPANPDAQPVSSPDPVIEALIAEEVDIDAITHADEPEEHSEGPSPSAERGAALITDLEVPQELHALDWQHSHTPEEAVELLALANPDASPDILADVVAYLWTVNATSTQLAEAHSLYDKNCAACHGETGGGDGPAADTTSEQPVAFSDPHHMMEMRGDVLYAKIRRGGMGTGMPNFGTLFTPQETWGLVDYLWSLAFSESSQLEHPETSDH